ncbi:Solute carrier family 45 member 3, partial [Stegodyphus mimosarum]
MEDCLIPNQDCLLNNAAGQYSLTDPVIKIQSCSRLKLIGINLLAFGIELCASAGFTYIPPIMLKSGFTYKTVTVVMGIGPFISLLLVPIIGRWSDRCQSRFGRRRPFMLALGILMIFSLLIIPFSSEIFSHFNGIISPNFGLAAGVILLDFSNQAIMNPCKALIPDIFHSLEEQSSGFTFYSCMLSLGGSVGYFITSVNWANTAFGAYFGGQEKAVFTLLAILLILSLFVNLTLATEKPLKETKLLPLNNINCDKNFNGFIPIVENGHVLDCFDNKESLFAPKTSKTLNGYKSYNGTNSFKPENLNFVPVILPWRVKSFRSTKSCVKRIFYILLLPVSATLNCNLKEYFTLPPVLFQLFIACLFGWMGIMCHDMYYSDFVGQVIYRGEPHAERESIAINRYDEGVRMGSWGLLLHCIAAAGYAAFIQERLIHHYGKHKIFLFGMLSFSLSMLGTVLTNNLFLVNVFAAASGLGLAAITTVPYSLVTEYYSKKEFESSYRGVGEDMAVLDSAFYLSQIIPSLFLGHIVEYTKSSSSYMVVAALCGTFASYFSYFVVFKPPSVSSGL